MPVVTADRLTKRFGKLVVDDLSFEIGEGRVTGFLGRNGAGKTTTLRMLLGLVAPTSGAALIDGAPYSALSNPTRTVGAVLEHSNAHPARTAYDHLRIVATTAALPTRRIDEVLELVELSPHARQRVGEFSLGMRQRLSLATALLGDPPILLLDEPTNGLDPPGVRWLRDLLRGLGNEGRTVVVSSHLLSEVSQTVDHVVMIDGGRLVADRPLAELSSVGRGAPTVRVRTPKPRTLVAALRRAGITAEREGGQCLVAVGTSAPAVGTAAASAGITLYELYEKHESLEDVFLGLISPDEQMR